MQQQFKMEDGTKRTLDKLVARRKLKKQYEYEVQWKGFDPTQNTWMPRDKCAPHISLHSLDSLPVYVYLKHRQISFVGCIETYRDATESSVILQQVLWAELLCCVQAGGGRL